ncbi:MAG: CoA pyrophosphatase [Deltaproteobacteria bacterium]|nr:CoA pyrophosphatase [Deltaproteobacteria bacterium]MBW1924037.1 CoA pyrophosphatase [Deltaproteobacteria bacterium]MBW1950382.1 CoA pyrophosphatase [Deltaproteobacteria bacterium]MBW2008341.1 CoA pyrophosphatase [Deltaproteobacteria bacterium]MBW2103701.1 CoA pyrophosphatase [Deltaproteobacteria bacterium]
MQLLDDQEALKAHILNVLGKNGGPPLASSERTSQEVTDSAVLFLLGSGPGRLSRDPCLILNKRSPRVKQAGDLCCPGGGISPHLDPAFARLLGLPFFPLGRWPLWRALRRENMPAARRLALLLATSLRESFEEMRLNPLSVHFLGALPRQGLVMFRRHIYPMVGWYGGRPRFRPNWEVEKIVCIPIRNLLKPEHYARYRITWDSGMEGGSAAESDFPCFLPNPGVEGEILWGATYRITMVFLDMVFGFRPPEHGTLPRVSGVLGPGYYNNRPA